MYYIVTVFDSLNYGSYFQAHALQWELEKYGEVRFVDIHHQSTKRQTVYSLAKNLAKKRLGAAILDLRKYILFSEARKSFKVIDISQIIDRDEDVYFFGSDEIWNIHREKIRKSKEFFGYGFPEHSRIALAPSLNQTSLEEILESGYVIKELKKFEKISVRDNHSKEVIEKATGKRCVLVADPTLMFEKDYYKALQTQNVTEEHFILLYTYGKMLKPDVMNCIRKYADDNGLIIVSIGRYFDFCDICKAVSPETFLTYICNADYVVTDTFHGLMFSLIYEKQFLTFPCGNVKVEESLEMLGLQNRLCRDINLFAELIEEKIQYERISSSLGAYSNTTKMFIRGILSNS